MIPGRNHATWCRSLFFRGHAPTSGEPLTEQHLAAFGQAMVAGGVRYAYLFSGPFDPDGALPDWAFSQRAKDSLARIRDHAPSLRLLPWVGGVFGKTVAVDRRTWRDRAVASTLRLCETLPVDGIHVDFECINHPTHPDANRDPDRQRGYGPGVCAFHRALRNARSDLFTSSVVVTTATRAQPWKHRHTLEELEQLYRDIDQIAYLLYDTGISCRHTFAAAANEQLAHLATLQDRVGSRAPDVLLGVGTFVNEPNLRPFRDLRVENLTHSLHTFREALQTSGRPDLRIGGLAVYCEWHTSPLQWRIIRERW